MTIRIDDHLRQIVVRKNWIRRIACYYAKKFAHLKSVPAAWWVALVGWVLAIVAIFDPSLAVTLHSMLLHSQ